MPLEGLITALTRLMLLGEDHRPKIKNKTESGMLIAEKKIEAKEGETITTLTMSLCYVGNCGEILYVDINQRSGNASQDEATARKPRLLQKSGTYFSDVHNANGVLSDSYQFVKAFEALGKGCPHPETPAETLSVRAFDATCVNDSLVVQRLDNGYKITIVGTDLNNRATAAITLGTSATLPNSRNDEAWVLQLFDRLLHVPDPVAAPAPPAAHAQGGGKPAVATFG